MFPACQVAEYENPPNAEAFRARLETKPAVTSNSSKHVGLLPG
jgi:hypothetical protein